MGPGKILWDDLRQRARSLVHSHTVEDAVSRWLEEQALRRDLRPATFTTYRNAARTLTQLAGARQVKLWSKADTSRLVDEIGTGSWCRKVLWVLRSVVTAASSWGWAVPPIADVECRLPQQDTREVYLTADQAREVVARQLHLIETLEHGSDRCGVIGGYLILHTGARISEMANARRDDIVIESDGPLLRGAIRVPASRSKNRKIRVLPLSGEAASVVARVLGEHCSEWLLPSGRVHGKPIGRVTISRQWKQLLRDLGMPTHYRVHDLRHTYASLAVQSGCELYHVQQALGHLEPRSTHRYAHLRLDDKVAVSEVVARRIGGAR